MRSLPGLQPFPHGRAGRAVRSRRQPVAQGLRAGLQDHDRDGQQEQAGQTHQGLIAGGMDIKHISIFVHPVLKVSSFSPR